MRELIAQAEALEEFAAQIDVAPDAVTPRLLSIALKQTAATYRAAAQPPAAQPVGTLIALDDGLGTQFVEWTSLRRELPVGTKLYATPDPRIAQLEADLAAAQADAERYRWLRTHYGLHTLREAQKNLLVLLKNKGLGYRGTGMALDVSIDAAIDAAKESGNG